MNEFLRYRFLIDSGVDVLFKNEINSLQFTYNFSDDYFRFLLVNSNSALKRIAGDVSIFFGYGEDNLDVLEEINEESFFSPYIFIMGRWDKDTLIGEVLVGEHKGAVVLLDEEQYCDIDSIEELFEDIDNVECLMKCDASIVRMLLSEELGVAKVLECSFIEFLENRLLLGNGHRC